VRFSERANIRQADITQYRARLHEATHFVEMSRRAGEPSQISHVLEIRYPLFTRVNSHQPGSRLPANGRELLSTRLV
jgi:hypothetical protein